MIDSFCNFDMGSRSVADLQPQMGREEGQLFKQSDWESSKLFAIKVLIFIYFYFFFKFYFHNCSVGPAPWVTVHICKAATKGKPKNLKLHVKTEVLL